MVVTHLYVIKSDCLLSGGSDGSEGSDGKKVMGSEGKEVMRIKRMMGKKSDEGSNRRK